MNILFLVSAILGAFLTLASLFQGVVAFGELRKKHSGKTPPGKKPGPNKWLLVSMVTCTILAIASGVTIYASASSSALGSIPAATPTPSFTQSGPVDLSPNSISYGGKINSWSKPAYNIHCELPDCDKTSKRIDILTEGTVVTAICWTYGQLVITGTVNPPNPGYQDIRWVRLQDGTYLPNTWFMRDKLSPQLPRC